MKVIDLLNKIANGEEVPQKIKVGNKIYNYETFNIGKGDNYFTAKWGEVKGYRISYEGIYYYLEIRDYDLNDEVEIIEEEKKIPEKINNGYTKQSIEDMKEARFNSNDMAKICNTIGWLMQNRNDLSNKIDEIIDTLEMLNDKIK